MPSGETVGRGISKNLTPLGQRFDPLTMKMLPWAMFGVLLAASCTAVMVGTGGGGVPPVVIVPAPVNVRATLRPMVAVPVRDGKEPVAPAYAPVPPVTVPRSEERRVGKECRSRWSAE